MKPKEIFAANQIEKLRKPVNLPRKGPSGWTICRVDPARVVNAFPSLYLKKGFVLRAYRFTEGNNGNAMVWAMPKDAAFPEPKHCPKIKTFLEPPRPPLALDDVMEVIEGDDSPLSYLSASIFKREIDEFGAMWHGCEWTAHKVFDKDPENNPVFSQGSPLTWHRRRPNTWEPSVRTESNRVKVSFYTFSGLGQEAIYHHVDTFCLGKYTFKTKVAIVATGASGYIY